MKIYAKKLQNWKIIKFSEAPTEKEVVLDYAALSFKCAQRFNCDAKENCVPVQCSIAELLFYKFQQLVNIFVSMNMNTIYNIKVSFLCCSDKILLNLQISAKHTLEEILILDLELKFGTKRKY